MTYINKIILFNADFADTVHENPYCVLTASSVLSDIIKLKQLSQKDISNLNFNRETLQENK